MSYEIRRVDLGLGEQLAGRALGDRLYNEAIAPALSGATAETILLLSFRGVAFVTGSIFKATWHRLHPDDGVVVPSMVAHLSDDVRAEFAIDLKSERVAGLEALDWSGTDVTVATLHGVLEDSAMNALQAVTANADLRPRSSRARRTRWSARLHGPIGSTNSIGKGLLEDRKRVELGGFFLWLVRYAVGEAFKRKRAAPFDHQNHRHYQALIDRDLLRVSRATETRFEVSARVANDTGLLVGSHCLVRERDGEYDVLHGNIVVARLPAEAGDTRGVQAGRTEPQRRLPCHVSRIGAFGSVSLKLDSGADDEP